MKIGITGATGFLGYHTKVFLKSCYPYWTICTANRKTFHNLELMNEFLLDVDAIIHFAGMNRGEDNDVESSNTLIAEILTSALIRNKSRPFLIYANSAHWSRNTPYGRGKKVAGSILEEWAQSQNASFINLIIPNVFGEFGRPFYNSVVSTFCYQLAVGMVPVVEKESFLNLIHAQEVAVFIARLLDNKKFDSQIIDLIELQGSNILVTDLLKRLKILLCLYNQNIIPNVTHPLDLQLFNTLRSYIFSNKLAQPIKAHSDNRGDLFEAVKTDNGGQTFISRTKIGKSRGNHYHLKKIERFVVLSGNAVVRLRRLFTDQIISINVNDKNPVYIDIPTFYTHSISNTGSSELLTLFWANELYDPDHPDTYSEQVLL